MLRRLRCDRQPSEIGSSIVEYVAALSLVAGLVGALLMMDLPGKVGAGTESAICRIFQREGCGATHGGPAGAQQGEAKRIAAIRTRQRIRQGFVTQRGGGYAATEQQINRLIGAGELDEAEALSRALDQRFTLATGGERGDFLDEMWRVNDGQFQQMVNQGSIARRDPGKPNDKSKRDAVRYFPISKQPGRGVTVMDFFIKEGSSGGILDGDGRGHVDPLRGGLPLDKSRMIVVLDHETGRAAIHVSHSCTENTIWKFCNNARPISFTHKGEGAWQTDPANPGGDLRKEDPWGDPDEANQFNIREHGDAITISYDALNSITPYAFSVDGVMELRYPPEGGRPPAVRRDIDQYPSVGWWWYDPKTGQAVRFDAQDNRNVFRGAPGRSKDHLPEGP